VGQTILDLIGQSALPLPVKAASSMVCPTRIGQPDHESGKCNDSSRLGTLKISSPPMPSFMATSVPADID
jgi:hypothetical protein